MSDDSTQRRRRNQLVWRLSQGGSYLPTLAEAIEALPLSFAESALAPKFTQSEDLVVCPADQYGEQHVAVGRVGVQLIWLHEDEQALLVDDMLEQIKVAYGKHPIYSYPILRLRPIIETAKKLRGA